MFSDSACSFCGDKCEVGYAMCHCGCGLETNIATSTYTTALGHRIVKGKPSMYRNGHRAKLDNKTSNSSLDSQRARIVRAMFAHQHMMQKDIARFFNVSAAAISKILVFDSYTNAGIATVKELDDFYSSFSIN